MSKVLIVGITGFVGSHLAEYLLREGHEVCGILRWRSKTDNIDSIRDSLHLENADIKDGYSLRTAFGSLKPDYCFHLAAQSFVLESWNSPLETMSANVLGTVNVLEALRATRPTCRVLVAGSSEEYGFVHPEEVPVMETNPLRPQSPYGVSKVATDLLGQLYHKSYGMSVVVTRAFNHTGPRRGEVFVTSNFAKQIALIEAGEAPPVVRVGNLEAERDFSDVRDIVRAYWLAITMGAPGEVYNICSERTYKIREVLETLLSMTSTKVEVERDEKRMRPSDVPRLLGNCSKFRLLTGWYPIVPFRTTLKDLLDYWREEVK